MIVDKCQAKEPKVLLLGSGELGLYITKSLKTKGATVIACDSYANAPAMRVADYSVVLDMTDASALDALINKETPDIIIPEVEAIATEMLDYAESKGITVVPSAKAVSVAMHRARLRNMAHDMGIKTSDFSYANNAEEVTVAVQKVGLPCIVKPVMSSSGRGMAVAQTLQEAIEGYAHAVAEGRGRARQVIVEQYVSFDKEFTLLTARTRNGVFFYPPIEHTQKNGDYRFSWMPMTMSADIIAQAQKVADEITGALGGYGVFGVEFFVKNGILYFNEVAPRPHDTGFVTLITQNIDQFKMHATIALGQNPPTPITVCAGCSAALLGYGHGSKISYNGVSEAEKIPGVEVVIFGKPSVQGHRRLGVILASDKAAAQRALKTIEIVVE